MSKYCLHDGDNVTAILLGESQVDHYSPVDPRHCYASFTDSGVTTVQRRSDFMLKTSGYNIFKMNFMLVLMVTELLVAGELLVSLFEGL